MPKLSGEKFYKNEYKKTLQIVDDRCKTAEQYAQICAMSLSRYRLQLAETAEFFPQADILPGYERILADMERFVCDGVLITNEMLQGYVDWCLAIKRACENTNIGYLAPWRKRVLPEVIQSLGEAFSNWMCKEMYREAIFYEDTGAFVDIGVYPLLHYETSSFTINPASFNYYQFIRSRHPDIEEIGRQRDMLRPEVYENREAYEKCCALTDLFISECKKYWDEAVAEKERLKAEYRPFTPEDIPLTIREMERIRADVQFVTTENPAKEDIRQRLRYYRTLDITDGKTNAPSANRNGI